MKKTITLSFVCIIVVALLMSLLRVDDFAQKTVANGHLKSENLYFLTFEKRISSADISKTVDLIEDLSDEFGFNVYLQSVSEEKKVTNYIKSSDVSYIKSLPVMQKNNFENMSFEYSTDKYSESWIFSLFYDVSYTIKSLNKISNSHFNGEGLWVISFNEKKDVDFISKLESKLKEYQISLYNLEMHQQPKRSSLDFERVMFIAYIILINLVISYSIFNSSKEITVKRTEGYSLYDILKSLIKENMSKWVILFAVVCFLIVYIFLIPFGMISKIWILSYLIILALQFSVVIFIAALTVGIIYRFSMYSTIKGLRPFEAFYTVVSICKMVLIFSIITNINGLSGTIISFININKLENDYISRLESYYFISEVDMNLNSEDLGLSGNELYNNLETSEKFSYNVQYSPMFNNTKVVIANKDYYDKYDIHFPESEPTVYYFNSGSSEFKKEYVSDYYSLNEIESISFIEIEEELPFYYPLSNSMESLLKENEFIIYIFGDTSFDSLVFNHQGSMTSAQEFINNYTEAMGMGKPFTINSFSSDYNTLKTPMVKSVAYTFSYMLLNAFILYFFNKILNYFQKQIHYQEDKINYCEGYWFVKSRTEYITYNSVIYLTIILLSVIYLKVDYIALLIVVLMLLGFDLLVAEGEKHGNINRKSD